MPVSPSDFFCKDLLRFATVKCIDGKPYFCIISVLIWIKLEVLKTMNGSITYWEGLPEV